MHPRRTVRRELGMDRLDLSDQVSFLELAGRGGTLDPLLPVVVARLGHTQTPASSRDVELSTAGLLRPDIGIDRYRSALRAKKAKAFPKMSSSSSFFFSSRRNANNSARSSPLNPPRYSRISASRTQFVTDVADNPNSLAIST